MTKEKKPRKKIIDITELSEASIQVMKSLKGLDNMERILILEKLLMTYKYMENKDLVSAEKSVQKIVLKKVLSEEQLKKDL